MAIKTFTVSNVKLNGTSGSALSNIESAALTLNLDTGETTSFQDSWKKYAALAKSWTLTVNAKYDTADTTASSLITEFVSGDGVVTSVTMYVTASSYFQGDTVLTGMGVNAGVNAVDTYSVTFLGNATLNYTLG